MIDGVYRLALHSHITGAAYSIARSTLHTAGLVLYYPSAEGVLLELYLGALDLSATHGTYLELVAGVNAGGVSLYYPIGCDVTHGCDRSILESLTAYKTLLMLISIALTSGQ